MNFCYPPSGSNTFDSYSLDNEQFPGFGTPDTHFDSNVLIADPSRSQGRYLNPTPKGYADRSRHKGPILLDVWGSQLVGPNVHSSPETGGLLYC